MAGSIVVYSGIVLIGGGALAAVTPLRRLASLSRGGALGVCAAGVLLVLIGFALPAPESRVDQATTRLDEFTPVWQFNEVHSIHVDASPEQVYTAIRLVRADEITLFRALTWIRRGGRPLPPGVLNAAGREPLVDVALRGGFVLLADDDPRELVVGTVILAPPDTRGRATPALFLNPLPPGFALATMNFVVTPDGRGGSNVRTETRVFANSASARRRFAGYWRIIYPGSAVIRRSWLRAIYRRATAAPRGPHA